jgi:hypothetical protein
MLYQLSYASLQAWLDTDAEPSMILPASRDKHQG